MSAADQALACRPLTVRGVRQILTRAGVDPSALTLEAVETVSLIPGREGIIRGVRISGPREARRATTAPLMNAGLTCAPLPEHATWDRMH